MTMLIPFLENWKDFPCKEWQQVCNSDGYGMIHVGAKNWTIHRLIWIERKGPVAPGYCVLHACDNRPCYALEHLGVGTQKDNSDDKKAKGRGNHVIGSKHGRAKLTEADVIQIKFLLALPKAERPLNREIGAQFGVTDVLISFIKLGRSWSHVVTEVDDLIAKIPRETIGIRNPMVKLTEIDIINIKKLLALPDGERLSHSDIGKLYGVAQSNITNINSGKRWGHITVDGDSVKIFEKEQVIEPHKEHSEATKEKIRIWRIENREVQNATNSRRQQRRYGITELSKEDHDISVAHRKAIKNDPCFYCGRRLENMQDDHMIPFSRGGTDHWFNIVRVCSDCNSRKNSMTADEYIEKRRRGHIGITKDNVIEIRRMLALPDGERPLQREIAEMYGVSGPMISNINTGKYY